MELNNPLRPNSNKLTRSEPLSPSPAPSTPVTPKSSTNEPPVPAKAQMDPKIRTSAPLPTADTTLTTESRALLSPEVRKALDALNAPEDLRKLMLQLTQNGIEIAGPRKVYVKHSYEIDQELHQRFHDMYPVLGFKKVKDAINDAIASWCDQNEAEYRRRSGTKK